MTSSSGWPLLDSLTSNGSIMKHLQFILSQDQITCWSCFSKLKLWVPQLPSVPGSLHFSCCRVCISNHYGAFSLSSWGQFSSQESFPFLNKLPSFLILKQISKSLYGINKSWILDYPLNTSNVLGLSLWLSGRTLALHEWSPSLKLAGPQKKVDNFKLK